MGNDIFLICVPASIVVIFFVLLVLRSQDLIIRTNKQLAWVTIGVVLAGAIVVIYYVVLNPWYPP
jgi:hypothetical protein